MNAKELATILGFCSLDGTVIIAAMQGLFTIGNAPMIALVFMAGPVGISLATTIQGNTMQRMLTALLAGMIATCMVIIAAGVGPKLLSFLNLNVFKFFGAVSILIISLMVFGIKLPSKLPLMIIIFGAIMGVILK